jgi:hypothetical protein
VAVLVLGQVATFLTYYSHYDSLSDYWGTWGYYYRRTERQALQLLLLLAITYTPKRHLWSIGLVVLFCKVVGLVSYYATVDWWIRSSGYYEEYTSACAKIGLYWPGSILFGDSPVSLIALVLVYMASMWVCWTQIRRPQAVELAV